MQRIEINYPPAVWLENFVRILITKYFTIKSNRNRIKMTCEKSINESIFAINSLMSTIKPHVLSYKKNCRSGYWAIKRVLDSLPAVVQ